MSYLYKMFWKNSINLLWYVFLLWNDTVIDVTFFYERNLLSSEKKTRLSCLSANHPIAGLVVYSLFPKYKNGSWEIIFCFLLEKQGISRDEFLLSLPLELHICLKLLF